MPMARSTPISRTRSNTFMVRVFTMPNPATITAITARASNRPKTWPSASLTAPSTRSREAGSRASSRALDSSTIRPACPASPGAKRAAKKSAPATPNSEVASDQPTMSDSPDAPGKPRSTIPETRRSADLAPMAENRIIEPGPRARRSARDRGSSTVPPLSRPFNADVRSPSTKRSRPSASMSPPTTAAASSRIP